MTALNAAAGVNSGAVRARASSSARSALALLLITASGMPVAAQRASSDSARAANDSLAIRLKRAEEAIQLLQRQLAEQSDAAVTTRSRMHLELNGRVLVHAALNGNLVNNEDNPQFVAASAATSADRPFVFTARQTTLGAVLTASGVLGGQFTGDMDVDFYGGQLSASGGRTFPLIRLRTARAAVRWSNGELLLGQESPLIAGTNPISPSAIGTPEFVAAGNLWLWLPQVRGTIETGGPVRFGVQAAVLANVTGDAVGSFDTDADSAERSGRPASEARVRVRWGMDGVPSEIGCGGHLGWINVPNTDATHAVACDARIALTPALEFRGEAYVGAGLRGLGGGGIGQELNRIGQPLDDRGGWAQLNVDATSALKLGAGCGMDAPTEADVATAGRLRNQSCAGYGILRPSGPLFFGLEVRQLDTRYASGSLSTYHVSFASGFEF